MDREEKVLIVSQNLSKLHNIENTTDFQQHVRDLNEEDLEYEYKFAYYLNNISN